MPSNPSFCTTGSTAARVVMDSPVPSISTHGEMPIPAAGNGSPASRKANSVAIANPPPAESPATAMLPGLIPWASSQRYAATASSTGAGKGCSGARR